MRYLSTTKVRVSRALEISDEIHDLQQRKRLFYFAGGTNVPQGSWSRRCCRGNNNTRLTRRRGVYTLEDCVEFRTLSRANRISNLVFPFPLLPTHQNRRLSQHLSPHVRGIRVTYAPKNNPSKRQDDCSIKRKEQRKCGLR